jgi:hypothetical protein
MEPKSMNERPTPSIRPGGKISASEFNRAMDRLDVLSDFSGSDVGSSEIFGSINLKTNIPPTTNIRILSGTNPYAWEEVYLDDDETTWIKTGVRSGTLTETPAIERTGVGSVAANTIAEAVFDAGPDGGGRWLFSVGGGGGGNTLCGWGLIVPGYDAAKLNPVFIDASGCFTVDRVPIVCGFGDATLVPGFDPALINIVTIGADGCLVAVHPTACTLPAFIDGGTLP